MRTGLFFGSFNPIHIGHMAIANYMVSYGPIDDLWFVVSPHNPLKKRKTLLNEYDRLELVNRAIGKDIRFKASNIEFTMPKPSYTIDTLTYLSEQYPKRAFSLIMGEDNLATINKWKNPELLLEKYRLLVYPRPNVTTETTLLEHPNVELIEAPLMEVSSSFIRSAIKAGKDVRYFMPPGVYEYIDQKQLYTN
ncbi:MAG: nicotinate (nicotinamide) nucleotide adenylyltransferase [Bacteroidales bacterium]|jgi:nicotinate-nucleotide adenylyltransferase